MIKFISFKLISNISLICRYLNLSTFPVSSGNHVPSILSPQPYVFVSMSSQLQQLLLQLRMKPFCVLTGSLCGSSTGTDGNLSSRPETSNSCSSSVSLSSSSNSARRSSYTTQQNMNIGQTFP